jgi:AbrB family looped-hinge helix DNA binding protein
MIAQEIVSTVTSKGQVTIPAQVRKHLRLKTKDRIVFVIEEEGTVRLAIPRYPDLSSLRGAAGSLKEPLSWQDVQQIAREDAQRAGQNQS